MAIQDDLQDIGVRLFLSVDIAGSTKFKSSLPSIKPDTSNSSENAPSQESPHNTWVQVYKEFFSDFPALFVKNLSESEHNTSQADLSLANDLYLWKMLGDELIFVTSIRTEVMAGGALFAFYKTINEYQASIQIKHRTLSLKGTAWTAGFPIRNRRVTVKQPNRELLVEDFIGPDMDIGFRLSKVARPGPIIVSMDLVDLLFGRSYRSLFDCYFVGWETMKGVFADKPYPVHWLVYKKVRLSLPPWEEAICRFAAGFSQPNEKESDDKIIERINKTRDVLNRDEGLDLFAPYLDKSDMPDNHKILHELLAKNENTEFSSEADFGVDEVEVVEATNA